VSSFLRIDGEETDIVGARLVWQKAHSAGRAGFTFHVTAHGARRMLHLAAWAPGDVVEDLSGQTVRLDAPGPDAAVDGRFFSTVQVRFGRVRGDRAVLSIDGEVEDMEPDSAARASVEADVRASVAADHERHFCLNCGKNVDDLANDREEFVAGFRVRRRVTPLICASCSVSAVEPRHCPICGRRYGDQVHALSEEAWVGYTATCDGGHTFSGTVGAPPNWS
jgi:hypothetical protein